MYTGEPQREYSHHVQHAKSHPSRVRNFDQPRHYPSHDADDDEMHFSEYTMSVNLPKGFKPPTDMEPYDGSFDPQEHMDAFKSRNGISRSLGSRKVSGISNYVEEGSFKVIQLPAVEIHL